MFPSVTLQPRCRPATRSALCLVGMVALVIVALPAALAAQEAESGRRTHVVKEGDTLWDLSGAYLTDPFLWPEIYRINTDVVEDPHWIYPGEVLRIPGPGELAVTEDQPLPDVEPTGPTVFTKAPAVARRVQTTRRAPVAEQVERAAVREGEFQAAPWVDRRGGPRERGKVVASAELPGIGQASDRLRMAPQDRIYITPPGDRVAKVGDRFLTYRLGADLAPGQLVVPTGIVQIEEVSNGQASLARIVRQFEEVRLGDAVMELERMVLPPEARPRRIDLGVESEVLWIHSEAVLPSLQHFVVLRASRRDGINVGDQFTLLRGRWRNESGVVIPEQPIALAQVVKVTDRAATAMIVDHVQPPIKIGTRARLTAKMP